MNNKKLQDELERLRREVNDAARSSEEVREKLNQLISDIEQKLDRPDDKDHHNNLVRGLKSAIGQFESEHPRATAILNDIMVTLSNMGI